MDASHETFENIPVAVTRMSGAVISMGSNVDALKAQRSLSQATDSLSSAYQRLSSGQRINKASDDSAGLAVTSSLRADIRIYNQARRNINDGISYLNIIDSSIANITGMIGRAQELAEQAANGTLGNQQRASLNEEAQALRDEYYRVKATANFNGIAVFDESIPPLSIQAGFGEAERLILSTAEPTNTGISSAQDMISSGAITGTGGFGEAVLYEMGSVSCSQIAVGDINSDGNVDLVAVGDANTVLIRLGSNDGTFQSAYGYTRYCNSSTVALNDLNNDGKLDLITLGMNDLTKNEVSVSLGIGDGTFQDPLTFLTGMHGVGTVSDIDSDGNSDLIFFNGDDNDVIGITYGAGDGTFGACQTLYGPLCGYSRVEVVDLDGDTDIDLLCNNPNGFYSYLQTSTRSFESGPTSNTPYNAGQMFDAGDLNGDTIPDMVRSGNWSNEIVAALGAGDGTFTSSGTYTINNECLTVALADLNGDEKLDLVSAGTSVNIQLGAGDGTFGSVLTSYTPSYGTAYTVSLSDVNGDGIPDLITGGGTAGYIGVQLAITSDQSSDPDPVSGSASGNSILPTLEFSLNTIEDAREALTNLSGVLDSLSISRGKIGAYQSRLSCALDTLATRVLGYTEADSQIADTDVAAETATLVRNQILQQTASVILAQANQEPNLAIRLLQDI